RMQQQLQSAVRGSRQSLGELQNQMAHRAKSRHQLAVQEVRRYAMQLRALSPLAVLERGYSVTRGTGGRVITKTADVQPGETVVTRVSDGSFEAQVLGVSGEEGGDEQ
ncbi:MAG: exodeoxyribonuclease VII large subunit, partial [Verrucomicrobia bacterium]|nr:exodeoxyribonuclease VII large subunit [Verrucomicrobiota bacterium]